MNFEIENSDNLINNLDYDSITGVPVFDASKFSYNDFFQNCMLLNSPCVLKNICDNWEASKLWVKDSKPNFDYLFNKYGTSNVTVYNCSERYFNSQQTHESTFKEYLKYWKSYKANNCLPLDYLKDWHLKLNNKNDNFYDIPICFASDWLNEYYTECLSDDYRFVYMGPKDTWTPFHADVFTSYSWSANVCGRKRWLFFPPGEEQFLKDSLGNLPYDVTQLNHTRKFFEVIQNSGEAVFVPSRWHHQVWNLDDTISVNHNWVNGCNIETMWLSMKNTLECIRREIEDCKEMEDFEEHCQVMLNASFGMDYYKFYEFLKFIAISRIEMVEGNRSLILFHGHKIGQNHILFDLKAVKNVLEVFINCDEINSLAYFVNYTGLKPLELLQQIVRIFGKT